MESTNSPLARIPEDIWLHVLSFLDFRELLNMSRLGKHHKLLAYDDSLWKQRCMVDFGEVVRPPDDLLSWRWRAHRPRQLMNRALGVMLQANPSSLQTVRELYRLFYNAPLEISPSPRNTLSAVVLDAARFSNRGVCDVQNRRMAALSANFMKSHPRKRRLLVGADRIQSACCATTRYRGITR